MRLTSTAIIIASMAAPGLRPDEGMWPFNKIPTKKMMEKYGFAPDQAWLDHLRLSSLRFPNGSGSFVSKDGLVLTNHHVGHDVIQAVSKDADFVKDGFVAQTRDQEIKVPDFKLRMLKEMIDITQEVEKSVPQGADERAATKARTATIAKALDSYSKKTGLECEPVTLYQGGEYWIYAYKVFDDVRLVACPEYQIAAFGKDDDNFTWPRHDLDFSLFRVYENGKPYNPSDFLKWSTQGTKHGSMTFVSGHPGSTSRLYTMAQMEHDRDVYYPPLLRQLEAAVRMLRQQARSSPEAERRVSAQLMGYENSLKALTGYHKGLLDKEQMAKVQAAEDELKAKVAAEPKLAAMAGDSWAKIEKAIKDKDQFDKEYRYISLAQSPTLLMAINYIRSLKEALRPIDYRLTGYQTQAELDAPKQAFINGPKAEPATEVTNFSAYLTIAKNQLGASHQFIQGIIADKATPGEAIKPIFEGTKMADKAFRNSLVKGGLKAIAASKDPLVALAYRIEPYMTDLRRQNDAISSLLSDNAARLAKARFEVYGYDAYPDATFTLRLSYGAVETFPMEGTYAQPYTTFYGLYDRAEAWGPTEHWGFWALPERWDKARSTMNLKTPFNFITNNDITGGNSGSPLVDKDCELVGLAFDGNIHSLAGTYYFDPKINRTIAVDSRAILEALGTVMGGKHLADEILGR